MIQRKHIPFVIAAVILYFLFSMNKNDISIIESNWEDISLPKNAKIEEVYNSDRGITGDGNRIYKLTINKENVTGTDLECLSCTNKFPVEEEQSVKFVIDESKKEIFIDDLEFIKSIKNPDFNSEMITITYSDKDKCYYLFEEIF